GADVMTGFSGETSAEFDESRAFIESLPFTYLHVFTYSERPGTPAAEMPDQVPVHIRKERSRVLRAVAAKKNLEFRRRMIGRTLSAVTLEEPRAAMSDNYIKVHLSTERLPNQLIEVEVGGLRDSGVSETAPHNGLRVL